MNTKIQIEKGSPFSKQTLHINKNKDININCTAIKFIDKDTKQFVLYIPVLELSGYGETIESAIEMLNFSIDDFCTYLRTLQQKELNVYLVNLGWRHDTFSKKDYLKAFVDSDGALLDYNALDNKIEYIGLQAA